MRRLLLCPKCRRQYDASGLPVGRHFRCRCGSTVEVREAPGRDAEVVRCSGCGATREKGAAACGYCGSDFTIHERDLHTICPSCLARISDRARFCHHCAAPIAPEETLGETTDRTCPVCGGEHRLASRLLGHANVSSLECPRCGGLWLGSEAFELLLSRARDAKTPAPDPVAVRPDADRPQPAPVPGGPAYRPCPVCSRRMNRSNFGRRSGVLLDRCRDHGCWFDAAELDEVLRWVRKGGEDVAEERRREEERMAASAARFRVEPKVPEDAWRADREERGGSFDLLPWIVRFFGDR
jgi:Zn-finger nucleic acid-binding protein